MFDFIVAGLRSTLNPFGSEISRNADSNFPSGRCISFAQPQIASAQVEYNYLYFEPGTTSLRAPDGSRQVEGRMVVDLPNSNIWGFPTLSGSPYPIEATKTEPTISEPFYLGKFDLAKIRGR